MPGRNLACDPQSLRRSTVREGTARSMSILPDQPGQTELPEATARAITDINAQADALNRIAAFLQHNADLPGTPRLHKHAVLVSLVTQPDPKAAASAWMNRAIDAGARVEPQVNSSHAGVELHFGAFHIEAYASAKQMGDLVEVSRTEWQLGIEIPEHARREQPADGA